MLNKYDLKERMPLGNPAIRKTIRIVRGTRPILLLLSLIAVTVVPGVDAQEDENVLLPDIDPLFVDSSIIPANTVYLQAAAHAAAGPCEKSA